MIRVTSRYGYTGVLSGNTTLTVYDSRGNKVMHTGSRNINTEDELIWFVQNFPELVLTMTEHLDEVTP